MFQLIGKLVKATLCPSRRFPGAKPRAFYISSAVKDLFGYYLKGKAIDINNIKSNVYLQLLDLDIRRKKYIEFLNHGAKCAGAGFLEGQQGTAVVYTTAEMSVAEEALKVLPQYSDPLSMLIF